MLADILEQNDFLALAGHLPDFTRKNRRAIKKFWTIWMRKFPQSAIRPKLRWEDFSSSIRNWSKIFKKIWWKDEQKLRLLTFWGKGDLHNKNDFNSQAFGWDSWVPSALKSIFGGTLFLIQLHDFSLLS